ncbi:twin-arginine translocase TatA/TatE family subunit [Paragemmobacter straminiformis]|uniref:Sec-independent protein translocase protein TatA n=1 Tax=Paragemmobacter straminiformis TaxID=2045119 RepID=A0A842IB13_9RHOB|nr:twin-arginine translocase TatA/TatE family subunit [Gemmobacter straminiformis]MBC2836801.1 twin-arginine translocase TatA/TatE family subunit [Gemmobacter straminiformis]
MGRLGPLEIIIIAAVVLVLFGRGKISNLMGEVGKGITAFKRGVKDGSAEAEAAAAAAVEAARDVTPETEKEKV